VALLEAPGVSIVSALSAHRHCVSVWTSHGGSPFQQQRSLLSSDDTIHSVCLLEHGTLQLICVSYRSAYIGRGWCSTRQEHYSCLELTAW